MRPRRGLHCECTPRLDFENIGADGDAQALLAVQTGDATIATGIAAAIPVVPVPIEAYWVIAAGAARRGPRDWKQVSQ